ncbi:ArsR/SmtB family transcription factor [Halomonas campaniensis]|uniref:ArsR/SmtB family transcription factor n=1 Tax=Halomonas campaniensis TaxID=213554 RepID=UPI00356338F3
MSDARHALYDGLAQVGRALGNGHRLALLDRLAQAEAPVETLAGALGLSVANASQHLQLLRRAGLVVSRREGRQVRYRLSDQRVVVLLGLLREIAEHNLAEMERLVSRLFDAEGEPQALSREALLARMAAGEVVLLDLRSEEEYREGHLPGARHLPFDRLESLLDTLPGDRDVVAYCRGPYCLTAREAERLLRREGLAVRRYAEGVPEWRAAGLPVE